jgi:hypothetical protein
VPRSASARARCPQSHAGRLQSSESREIDGTGSCPSCCSMTSLVERRAMTADLLQPVSLSCAQFGRTVLQQDQAVSSGSRRATTNSPPTSYLAFIQLASIRLWRPRHSGVPDSSMGLERLRSHSTSIPSIRTCLGPSNTLPRQGSFSTKPRRFTVATESIDNYSTVTDFARFLGRSTVTLRITPAW